MIYRCSIDATKPENIVTQFECVLPSPRLAAGVFYLASNFEKPEKASRKQLISYSDTKKSSGSGVSIARKIWASPLNSCAKPA